MVLRARTCSASLLLRSLRIGSGRPRAAQGVGRGLEPMQLPLSTAGPGQDANPRRMTWFLLSPNLAILLPWHHITLHYRTSGFALGT